MEINPTARSLRLGELFDVTSLSVFCAWGDGPAVGINAYDDLYNLFALNLTVDEARRIAALLVRAADTAEELDEGYSDDYYEVEAVVGAGQME